MYIKRTLNETQCFVYYYYYDEYSIGIGHNWLRIFRLNYTIIIIVSWMNNKFNSSTVHNVNVHYYTKYKYTICLHCIAYMRNNSEI